MRKFEKLLVDIDVVVYRASAIVTNVKDFDGNRVELPVTESNLRNAKRIIINCLDTWQMKHLADGGSTLLAASKGETFRHKIYPKYKAHRPPKPEMVKALYAWLFEGGAWFDVTHVPGIEADDVIGMATHPSDTLIVSNDKDFRQFHGHLYNINTGEILYIDADAAEKAFYAQVLTGDSADGYKGVPGIGPVKAEEILDSVTNGNYWDTIAATYMSVGMSLKAAVTQARLAYILHPGDGRFYRWTPPTTSMFGGKPLYSIGTEDDSR